MAQKQRRIKAASIVPVAGARVDTKLKNGFKNFWLRLVARATVTVTVAAATALRNRGSVWALFDEIGLDENGTDRHIYDGRILRFLSEMHAPSALFSVRAATGVAVYNLEEHATMFFAHPLAASPEETLFREIDAREDLRVFAKLNSTPNARIYDVGPATVAITNISIDVEQVVDDKSPGLPFFISTARQMRHQIPGANDEEIIYLKVSRYLRALAIQQETTTVGEVSDIITSLALRGDNRDIIGPQQVSMRDLILDQEAEYGGLVVSGGYLGLNFQENGKLANVINPAEDVNLRLEMKVAPSASAGTSQVRVSLLELERTSGLVVPQLPFEI